VVRDVFGKTDECLDIYHAAEQKEWFERMHNVLLPEGLSGMERELSLLKVGLKEWQVKSMDLLLDYFHGNSGRLNYSERLVAGRAIGSGLIEGACKNLVGRRLKQTGACWRLERVNRIASLCAALYSNQWEIEWKNTHSIWMLPVRTLFLFCPLQKAPEYAIMRTVSFFCLFSDLFLQ